MTRRVVHALAGLSAAVLVGIAATALAQAPKEDMDSVAYGGETFYFPKKDSIKLPADIPETHKVVTGDTLWGIAGKYLKDNFLWPIVWEENLETIPNPHLIYPDQIVKLPHGASLTPAVAAELDQFDEAPDETVEAPRPVAWTSAMESAGFIAASDDIGVGTIVASDGIQTDLATGDIVYIDLGREDDIEPGDEFSVIEVGRVVRHPKTRRALGHLVSERGRIKVLCVQDDSATARIVRAYTSIRRGQRITPYAPEPIPTSLERPIAEACPPRTNKIPGVIVDSKMGVYGTEDGVILGEGSTVYLSVGAEDGVAPGDFFRIFQDVPQDPSLPELKRGELVVLKVQDKTSTALIVQSTGPMYVGDEVELK